MSIYLAPVLEGRNCKSLSFIADLRTLRPLPKREETFRRRYEAGLRRYFSDLNERFVGSAYTALTGQSLRHSYNVMLGDDAKPARVSIWLICPQSCDFGAFQSEVCSRWLECAVAGEHIFINPPRTKAPPRETATMLPSVEADGGLPRRGWWQRTSGEGEAVAA